MRLRRVAACLVLMLVPALVATGMPLEGLEVRVSTPSGVALTFDVTVLDGGIDALAPEEHAIVFTAERGPAHGVVTGDLDAVLYSEPSQATLVLTYTPAIEFVGEDSIVLRAEDPVGESARVEIAITVRERATRGAMTGDSILTATIDVPAASLASFDWRVEAKYSILAASAGVGFHLHREAADLAFDALSVTGSASFSDAVTATGRVDFDPDSPEAYFESATASLVVRAGATSWVGTASTDGTQTGSRMTLALAGTAGSLSTASSIALTSCSPWFEMATITIGTSEFPCSEACAADLRATVALSDSGFERATFAASGVDLPDIGLLSLVSSASVVISYAVQTKSLTISPELITSIGTCFSLGTEVTWDGGAESVTFTTIHVDQRFQNGVRLSMDASLDPTNLGRNQAVTGYLDYWEVDALSGDFDVCAGIRGDWEVGVYFARPLVGLQLFDWGMLEFRAAIECNGWRLFTDLFIRSGVFGDSTAEWLLGFETNW